MEELMPCTKGTMRHCSPQETEAESCESNKIPKAKHACIAESHESKRQRLESSQPKDDEDHIAGKGYNSMTHLNLVSQVFSFASSDENSGCESSIGEGMEEIWDDSSLGVEEGQKQEGGHSGSTQRQKESPLCYVDGHLSSQICRGWNQNFRSVKAESCSEETSWWTTLGLVQSLLNKARLRLKHSCKILWMSLRATWQWWTSNWRGISMHSGNDGGCSQIAQNPKVRMSRYMDASSTTSMATVVVKHWRYSGFLLKDNYTDTYLLASCGKDSSKFHWDSDGEKYRIGNVFSFKTRIILIGFAWMTWLERCRIWLPCGRKMMKTLDQDEPTSFLDRILGMHSTWMQAEGSHYWWTCQDVRITKFCWSNWKITGVWKASRKDGCVVLRLWKDKFKKCVERYCDLAKRQQTIRSLDSSLGWSSFQERGTWISWRNFQGLLTNCPWNACTWHELVGPDILWSVNKLARSVTKWTGACDRISARLISYIHHTNDYGQ